MFPFLLETFAFIINDVLIRATSEHFRTETTQCLTFSHNQSRRWTLNTGLWILSSGTLDTHHHHKHILYIYYILFSSADLRLIFEWVLIKLVYHAYKLAFKNPIGQTSSMRLFHANFSSTKRLAASHFNPMSNSFIFIMDIHVVCCLPLDSFVFLSKY